MRRLPSERERRRKKMESRDEKKREVEKGAEKGRMVMLNGRGRNAVPIGIAA
jgi:hypothetical protein